MANREGDFEWGTITEAKRKVKFRCQHCGKKEGTKIIRTVTDNGKENEVEERVKLYAHHIFPLLDERSKLGKYLERYRREMLQIASDLKIPEIYITFALSTAKNIQILCKDCHLEAHHHCPETVEEWEARDFFYHCHVQELLQIAQNIKHEQENPQRQSAYLLALRNSQ